MMTRVLSGITTEVWSSFFFFRINKPEDVLLSESLATGLCLLRTSISHRFAKSQPQNDLVVP